MKVEQIKKLEQVLNVVGERSVLLNLIRFGRKDFKNSIDFIDFLTQSIAENPILKHKLLERLLPVFHNISMQKFLTDFGMFSENGLISQFFQQIGNKILPQISDDQTLLSLINDVLYSKTNHNYVRTIPINKWVKFYEVLFDGDVQICDKEYVKKQIKKASTVLIGRIIGGATDIEMLKLSYIKDIDENPFQKLAKNLFDDLHEYELSSEKLRETEHRINKCYVFLDNIINQREKKGISLNITIKITQLRQQLTRLEVLIKTLNLMDNSPLNYSMANLTKNWLNFYTPQNNVRHSFQSTLYVLTFLITWYNGQTGEKYITSNSREYLRMLKSALGGGFIVSILCFIKTQVGMETFSPFMRASLYSLNYAWGFVAIYLMHWTLATKQPAMTAASLAHTLNQEGKEPNDYKEFGLLFSRLFRSQFISFMGNIAAVFPLTVLFFYLLTHFLGFEVIDTHKALEFKDELITWDWKIFYFSAIAGVFLFLSGMISGMTENYNHYNKIPERIFNHPLLKRFAKEKNRRKFAQWYDKRMGGIIGNAFLGICLGCAFLVGEFMGVPFDIRHITFSAGNYALALCHFKFDITWRAFLIGFAAVFSIGIVNFLVSFSLSLWVAMKSVNIPTKEIGKILYSTLKLFIKNPVRFFIPVK